MSKRLSDVVVDNVINSFLICGMSFDLNRDLVLTECIDKLEQTNEYIIK